MPDPAEKHYFPCPECGGRGVETISKHETPRLEARERPCSFCRGAGLVYDVLEVIGDGERLVVHPLTDPPATT